MDKTLVTGAVGFIGFHLCKALLDRGAAVTGVDNLNPYYDVSIKEARLSLLRRYPSFSFKKLSIEDREETARVFAKGKFEVVVHLAAQAGVRYSIENPMVYIDSNLTGFGTVLEGCRRTGVKHLVFASSSSVYGANRSLPFSESQNVDHPISLYAATKKSNELMAHAYSSLFGLPVTGLRFFTVYGPWGRPDMAIFKFTKSIYEGKPIDIYNHGDMKRDFTYVDDIVDGIMRVMRKPPQGDAAWKGEAPSPATSYAPYRVYNIGNNRPESLMRMVSLLETLTGRKAAVNFLPIQAGDVKETAADITLLNREFGFEPKTRLEDGLKSFVEWYADYFGVKN